MYDTHTTVYRYPMRSGVGMTTLHDALGEAYRLAVIKSDHARAVSYIAGLLRDGGPLLDDARKFCSAAGNGGRLCYATYVSAAVLSDALALLRAEEVRNDQHSCSRQVLND